jgi:peptide/nickel transport system substrate-binding protein
MIPHAYRPLALLLLLATLGGCTSADAGGDASAPELLPEEPRYGGTAVVALPFDPISMNPLGQEGTILAWTLHQELLFTPLFRLGEDLEPVPALVERWDSVRVAPDTLALTFHLRRDVFWHDGVPTTADDVVFTWHRALDPATAWPMRSSLEFYDPAIERVDSFTVRLRARANAGFLSNLIWLIPAPRHLLESTPAAGTARHPYGREPVGNGRFRFVRYASREQWVFEANADYPRELGGRPYLDRLVLRIVPEPTSRLTELLAGSVDVMLEVRPQQARAIGASRTHRLLEAPSVAFYGVFWNTRAPQLRDARVRRALTLAMDRQAMVDVAFDGRAGVGRTPVRPIDWMFDATASAAPDPAAAAALLEQAGWTLRPGETTRRDEAGRPLRFQLLAPSGYALEDVLVPMQAQLQAVGAEMSIRMFEVNTLFDRLAGAENGRGEWERDFEAAFYGLYTFVKDDREWLHSRHRTQRFTVTGYESDRLDSLMDTLAVVLDREAALPLWRAYQRMLIDEAPVSVVYYKHHLVGVHRRMQGVSIDARGEFPSVARWWLSR